MKKVAWTHLESGDPLVGVFCCLWCWVSTSRQTDAVGMDLPPPTRGFAGSWVGGRGESAPTTQGSGFCRKTLLFWIQCRSRWESRDSWLHGETVFGSHTVKPDSWRAVASFQKMKPVQRVFLAQPRVERNHSSTLLWWMAPWCRARPGQSRCNRHCCSEQKHFLSTNVPKGLINRNWTCPRPGGPVQEPGVQRTWLRVPRTWASPAPGCPCVKRTEEGHAGSWPFFFLRGHFVFWWQREGDRGEPEGPRCSLSMKI